MKIRGLTEPARLHTHRITDTCFIYNANPVLRYNDEYYPLCGIWQIQAEMRPVHWGAEEIMFLPGIYIEPLRGYRLWAHLSSQAVHYNDWAILNELRRYSARFTFYPWGTMRSGWNAMMAGSNTYLAYRLLSPGVNTSTWEILGSDVIPATNFEGSGILRHLEADKVQGEIGWTTTIRWNAYCTTGKLTITLQNETFSESETLDINIGHITLTIPWEPLLLTYTHNLTPFILEVEI